MPIPLIVGGIVSAATALGSAKVQSNAAKNAAKEQQKGTDRALQVQQQAHQPYMDLGKAAAARLAAMPQEPYTQQFRPSQPGMPGVPGQPASSGFQAFNPGGGGSLAGLGQPPQAGSMPGASGAQVGGGMVTLQAPTGETVRMPDGPMVQQALQRGARRVG
jgi:hypothetical protein